MINNKILGLIGFSARARKVSFGSDSVELKIKNKKAKLIIIACDASNRTKNKFFELSKKYEIPIIEIESIDSLSKAIGKANKAVLGIEDENLASEILRINNGGEFIG